MTTNGHVNGNGDGLNGAHADPPATITGGEGGLQVQGDHRGHDRRLVARAARSRWPVSDAIKKKLMEQVEGALEDEDDPRALGQLGRIVQTAEGQNQADEHLAIRAVSGLGDVTVNVVYVDAPDQRTDSANTP